MDWILEHLASVLISIQIMVLGWLCVQVVSANSKQAVLETKVDHINRAVNNVGQGEKTLRTLVEENNVENKMQALRIESLQTSVKGLEARTENLSSKIK